MPFPVSSRAARLACAAVAALLGLAGAAPARAQQESAAARLLTPSARAVLAATDPALGAPTVAAPDGRRDARTGVQRAAYRIAAQAYPGRPQAAATAYLRRAAAAFGWDADLETLRLRDAQQTPAGFHFTYEQTLGGVPVWGSYVKVSVDRQGRPTMAVSGYRPEAAASEAPLRPLVDAVAAAAVARGLVAEGGAEVGAARLVVYPEAPARLAWALPMWPEAAPAEWLVFVDARTGALVRILETAAREQAPELPWAAAPAAAPATTAPSAAPPQAASAPTAVNGRGLVFDPDPLTSAGAGYGGAFRDNGDSPSAALQAQMKTVVLREIVRDSDGLYRLEGPYVRVVGQNSGGATNYSPPAEADPAAFRYDRNDERFEGVMVYYHADKSQRYADSLLFLGAPSPDRAPVRINPHGRGLADDSWFLPERFLIEMGAGGIDDAEDGGVIWHEHAHAILETASRSLRTTSEGMALHEGWADYWAASYVRGLIESGAVPPRDWRRLFFWDGNETWNGRFVEHRGVYPADTHCDDATTGCSLRQVYDDGIFWAAALMDVYTALGKSVTDRLALASHHYLSVPVTFRDAAEALVQADVDLYGGAHRRQLAALLAARGLADAGAFGPAIAHTPEADVETVGGSLRLQVVVRGVLPVTSAALYYQSPAPGASWSGPVPMRALGEDRYEAVIPKPSAPGYLRYYFAAADAGAGQATFPFDAPTHVLRAPVGNVAAVEALQIARATGAWQEAPTGWNLSPADPAPADGSTLVWTLMEAPANAEGLLLELEHRYHLGEGKGGRLEMSLDGGRTWALLTPEGGYPASLDGAGAFSGVSATSDGASVFDLAEAAGRQVWLRARVEAAGPLSNNEFWRITGAKWVQATFDQSFTIERRLTLHPNFPDPFSDRTTVMYTLESTSQVSLELYNVLGMRVAVLETAVRQPGTHTVTLSADGLAGGVYFIRLRTDEGIRTERAVLMR